MDEEWQLEAVNEQFEVFDSLTKPYLQINTARLPELIGEVTGTISKHLQVPNKQTSPSKNICAAILNQLDSDMNGNLSFIVVVTNQHVNNKLSKIPIFVINFQNSHVFLDLNCGVYKTWAAFMKNNDLPACKFCFPVDGHYKFRGKLAIDFGSSPKSSMTGRLKTMLTSTPGIIVVAVGGLAASYFFKIQPRVFGDIAKAFLPSAEGFLGTVTRFIDLFDVIINIIVDVYQNGFTMDKLGSIFRLLNHINTEFKQEISDIFTMLREKFVKVFRFINQKLQGLFESASDQSRNEFLAVADQTNHEMIRNTARAEAQLSSTRLGTESQLVPVSENHDNLYLKQIFDGVVENTAVYKRMDDKSGLNLDTEPFHNKTQDLLIVSRKLAETLKIENLNDVKDIFEAVKTIVVHKYEKHIYDYSQVVAAARTSSRDEFDLTTFNECLKIRGDPEGHYWQEALKVVEDPFTIPYIKDKIKQVQSNKRIFLIRLWKQTENSTTGFYKCTGITGKGKISASSVIEACKSQEIILNEDNVVINETTSQIFIRSNMYSVALFQELNEENTAEGLVYIAKHSE